LLDRWCAAVIAAAWAFSLARPYLALMRAVDALHLEYPFAGIR
jgi:hypothetical protein